MGQNRTDEQYADQIQTILRHGYDKGDRTGTGTISRFGLVSRYNNKLGRVIPVVAGKKTNVDAITKENLWFISGTGNIKGLQDQGVKIWNEWADENGDLGPVYGVQWRKREDIKIVEAGDDERMQKMRDRGYEYQGVVMKDGSGGFSKGGVFPTIWKRSIDQLANAIERLKTNPECRRIIVDAWNPADLEDMKLPPCHMTFIFNTHKIALIDRLELYIDRNIEDAMGALCFGTNKDFSDKELLAEARTALLAEVYGTDNDEVHAFFDGENIPVYALDCAMVQRSADFFVGVPFNVTGYCLLMHMVGKLTNMAPNELAHFTVDSHLYKNHIEQAHAYLQQLEERIYEDAKVTIKGKQETIDDFEFDDFVWSYDHGAYIKAPIAV